MSFEDAIAALGSDLGIDLVVEDGAAEFVAMQEGGREQFVVSISAMDDSMYAVLCADLGEMPSEGADEIMLRMLEANHLFDATGGAALSVEDGRAKLERYVGIVAFHRGVGAKIVMPFIDMARRWRGIIAGDDEREEGTADPPDTELTSRPLAV